MRERVYDAWETARTDIFRQWQEQTDPLNVQPDIRRLFREVAEHLRKHWPDDMTQEKLRETVESVEAPWGRRYEGEIREVYEDEDPEAVETLRALVDKVDALGLQPFDAPYPLPPLEGGKRRSSSSVGWSSSRRRISEKVKRSRRYSRRSPSTDSGRRHLARRRCARARYRPGRSDRPYEAPLPRRMGWPWLFGNASIIY